MIDPIVAEVRKNREEWFAEFDCDTIKFQDYIREQQAKNKAAGVSYMSEEERQTRQAWKRQQREDENHRIANL